MSKRLLRLSLVLCLMVAMPFLTFAATSQSQYTVKQLQSQSIQQLKSLLDQAQTPADEEMIGKVLENKLPDTAIPYDHGANPLRDIADWVVDEGFESAVPPTGWTAYETAGDPFEQTSSRANSGSFSVFHDDSYTDNDAWLISPAVDLSGMTSPVLKYFENVNFVNWAETHNVVISTDYSGTGDPTVATWDTLNSEIGTEDTWVEKTFDISAYSGTIYIAFQYVGNGASEWYIDDVLVGELPSNPVMTLEPLSIDFGAANIGEIDSAVVKVTNSGGADLTITDVTSDMADFQGSPTALTIAPATSDTIYAIWTPSTSGMANATITVASNDVVSDNQISVSGIAFSENYITEGFEPEGNLPEDWSETGTWYSTSTNHSGTSARYATYSNESAELITPRLNVSSGGMFGFYWREGSTDNPDSVLVSVSDDGGATWTQLGVVGGGSSSDWIFESFDLSSIASDNVYIKWNYVGDGSFYAYSFYIDDITLPPLYIPSAEILPVLISEIVVTPTGGEFVEIYNPNDVPVDLSDFYLTDATYAGGGTYYYNITTGSNFGGGEFGDFHARFPDGAQILDDEYQTVALNGSDNFYTEYGVDPTYELYEDGASADAIPDMREAASGSINSQGGLTNSDEVVMLYYWDGSSNLVQDSDYLLYSDDGVPNEAVDKTGVTVGGETYLDDTPIAEQDYGMSPGDGFSLGRVDLMEGDEIQTGGNGITGNDETSENTNATFQLGLPSPGMEFHPADMNEPNDNLANATPISSGDSLNGIIDPEDDLDFYTFTLTGQASVEITMYIDGYSDLDGEIALFADDSTQIDNMDDSGTGSDEVLSLNVLDAGTYYIAAGYWGNIMNRSPQANTGNYAISLETGSPLVDPNEPNNDLASATVINSGDSLNALIDPENDLDFYTFTLAEQSSVDITMFIDGYSDLDGEIALFADDSTQIDNMDDSGTGSDEVLSLNVLDAGTYYILTGYYSDVMNRSPQASTGAYALSLETDAPIVDNYEPNNSLSDATVITDNDTLMALVEPDGDIDVFKLTLPGPGMLTVDMFIDGYSDLDGAVTLLAADSSEIDRSDSGFSGDDEQIAVELSPGIYYIAAGHYSDVQNRSPQASTGQYMIGFNFAEYTTGAISGMVTDLDTSNPIENAIVSAGGVNDTTDAAGEYLLENIASGLRSVKFMASGYQSAVFNVNVVVGDTITQDATLNPITTDVIYENGFEAGDDMGSVVSGGTHAWERSAGFTFESADVNPAQGDSLLVVGGAEGYDNDEFSWWMNLPNSDMDLTAYNSAAVHLRLYLDSEEGYDFVTVLANQPDVDGTYYYLDINGDGIIDASDQLSGHTNGWVDVTADLSPFTGPDFGDGVEIALLFSSDGSVTSGFGAAVDSLVVTASVLAPVLPPQNLTATSFQDGEVPLTWDAPPMGAHVFHTLTRDTKDNSRVELGKGKVSNHGMPEPYSREWNIGNGRVESQQMVESYNVFRVNLENDPMAEMPELVANVSETSYTDASVTNFNHYAYAISAVHDVGESDVSNIVEALPGMPTTTVLPVMEDFEGVTPPDLPGDWNQFIIGENGWATGDSTSASSTSMHFPQHGQFVYVNDDAVGSGTQSMSILWTPWMDASGADNVLLQASTYAEGPDETRYLVVRSGLNYEYTIVDSVPETDGWETGSIDLSDVVGGESYFQVGFLYSDAGTFGWGWALDDITIEAYTPGTISGTVTSALNDAPVAGATVYVERSNYFTTTGPDGSYSLTVPPGDYSVTVEGEDMEPKTLEATVSGGTTTTLDFALTPHIRGVKTLVANDAEGGVSLQWSFVAPVEEFMDDFESYPAFSTMFNPWTLVDGDGSATYPFQNFSFPGDGAPMSYIIFNPDETTPPMDGNEAHSGSQYAAAFTAVNPPNDDWMISPPIITSETTGLSFWAKSITDQYGLERFKVLVSTTDRDPSSFTAISEGEYLEAPVDWTEFDYDLSAYAGETIYIAIQCTSDDAFSLFVDDFMVGDMSTDKDAIAYNNNSSRNSTSETTRAKGELQNVAQRVLPAASLEGFDVYRGTDPSSLTLHASVSADTYSMKDSVDMEAGTTYYYAVMAMYDMGGAAMSDTVEVTYTGTVANGIEMDVPQSFALEQNYPNPFNPTTAIKYQLPKAAPVQIAIYNMLGQQIRTLVNETQQAGYYEANWDGRTNTGIQASSGVYFYRIKAGSFTQTRKMMLLK